jgi:hypothetical protein
VFFAGLASLMPEFGQAPGQLVILVALWPAWLVLALILEAAGAIKQIRVRPISRP